MFKTAFDLSTQSVGLENENLIPDAHITATSSKNGGKPHYIRMNSGKAGWRPTYNNQAEYIQIDIGAVYVIHAVGTQGKSTNDSWFKEYRLRFSLDGGHWDWYTENGVVKVWKTIKYYTRFFIRTSKFWPSLVVLKFLHNLNLNCS